MGNVDLQRLQDRCKRDPEAYKSEFVQTYKHYESLMQIFDVDPKSSATQELYRIIPFVAQVAGKYRKETTGFADALVRLMDESASVMDNELRLVIVRALLMLHARQLAPSSRVLPLCLRLLGLSDRPLRAASFGHVVSYVQDANKHRIDHKLNGMLQQRIHKFLQDDTEPVIARKCLDVMIALYRRRVWMDANAVNIISGACLKDRSNPKLSRMALKFFLSVDLAADDESSDDESSDEGGGAQDVDPRELADLKRKAMINKGRKTRRRLDQALKLQQKKARRHANPPANFAAMDLIHDPQGFAERLLSATKKSKAGFEARMLALDVISRLIGIHKLLVDGFYSYLLKYITPTQRDVTKILAIIVQGCHDEVSEDLVSGCVAALISKFCVEYNTSEVISLGLNTVREIASRTPAVITRQTYEDLTLFRRSRDKGVRMASQSLLATVRALRPGILKRKEMGRFAATHPDVEGSAVASGVPFAELLDKREGNDDSAEGDGWRSLSDNAVSEGQANGSGEELEMVEGEDAPIGRDPDGEGSDGESFDGEGSEGDVLCIGAEGLGGEKAVGQELAGGRAEQGEDAPSAVVAPPDARRILTQEDFKRLKRLRAAMELDEAMGRGHGTKRMRTLDGERPVNPDSLEGASRRRDTREERIASAVAGRADEKHGSKRGENKGGGSTNKRKRRTKVFAMVKSSMAVKGKTFRSAREKRNVRVTHARRQRMKYQAKRG